MERYVEVIGEAKFTEAATFFVAEVTLEVRASKDETALAEAAELFREAISALKLAGISDAEIVEGGTDFFRPWYWRKKVGQNAARKIILKVEDFNRLNRALETLEPLQSQTKDRKTISVNMRQPEFETAVDVKSKALEVAFAEAKSKAEKLASASGESLGAVIHIEEGGWAKRNSGFSGDEDWWGDYSRFAAGGAGVVMASAGTLEEPNQELQRPTRTVFIKCRVRFALVKD